MQQNVLKEAERIFGYVIMQIKVTLNLLKRIL